MDKSDIFGQLDTVLAQRRNASADDSYTASLYAGGNDAITAKIAEESGEVIEAADEARDGDGHEHLVHEVADLWFHCMVLLQANGASTVEVEAELARRFGVSGLEEKAARAVRSQ